MRGVIIIPARMAATRFPGKPLIDLGGKPMIQWVYEAARRARGIERVIVATPDPEIERAVARFGGESWRTRADHPSGTDRIAEIAETLEVDFFLNVQGDEPLIEPAAIEAVAAPLTADPAVMMTSAYAQADDEEIENPNVVKVVTDDFDSALYFSRCPIPFARGERRVPINKHLGLYGYRREVVLSFQRWGSHPLEQTEALEQLRFLAHGVPIQMVAITGSSVGIDTPEQAEALRQRWPIRTD